MYFSFKSVLYEMLKLIQEKLKEDEIHDSP